MKAENLRKKAVDLILAAAGVAAFCFLAKKFFFLILPLFGALLFSEGIKKSFRRMKKVSPGIRKTLVILMLLILFALILLCLVLLADRAVRVFRAFSETAGEKAGEAAGALTAALEKLEAWFSRVFHREFRGEISAMLPEMMKTAITSLLSRAPGAFTSLFSSLPGFLIGTVLFLVATYSLSCEDGASRRILERFLPREKAEKALMAQARFFAALKKYLRAYFLLFLLTFSECVLGLAVLKLDKPFQTAFLIALVDLLPVFGSGTVLVPWAIFSFVTGAAKTGAGLLILYAAIFVIRQFAEPKIVGDQLGMHPVLSLVLLVAGLKFFGVWGLIFFPMIGACLTPYFAESGT